MIDNCYIDGISARSRFGVWVTKGGYKDLLTFPALAVPDTTSWPEEDGIEVDLSEPRLQEKDITISFLASDPNIDASDFIAYVSNPGYHTLYVPILKRTWQLRLSDQPTNRVYPSVREFSLKFVEDAPVRPVASLPDPGILVRDSGYELDGVSFADYGVVVDVARDELLKAPAAKKNLCRKVSTTDGQIYDVDHLVFESKDVTFKCHFKAVSMDAFWQCYDAFFAALTQPEERQLYVDYTGEEYPCYYKQSSGFKILSISNPVLVEFSFTLVFTVFRVGETEYLLATEGGELIVLEDDGETVIDLGYGE